MMKNPTWDRQIAISKVQLEVMMMELQMEFEQGASVYGVKNNGTNKEQPKVSDKIEQTPATPQ